MSHTITKEFRFEAAHRLTEPYRGKCAHLHGHSWVVRLSVGSDTLDKCGFVQDFSSLSPLRDWIRNHFDHATLASASDPSLLAWLRENAQKHVSLPVNPTSEIVAHFLYEKARELGLSPLSVEVMETCTCSVRYQPSRQTAEQTRSLNFPDAEV
jgi:6-pyruvoyltetrahydropterin/6-carboxytetrahydropterin synthase